MSVPGNDSNALWTKYALLLLASIAVVGVALLGCVICLIPWAERMAPKDRAGLDIAANTATSQDDEQRDDRSPPQGEESEDIVRSKMPGVMLPLDQAMFLGTPSQGRRFCIIADASNSMKGAPLNHVKQEIVRTVGDLKSSSQFYIIFFNATDRPMPFPSWLDANAENLAKVKPWVQKMPPALYTWPKSSFDRAFKLQPKPDVIYFMTDGFIPAKENTPKHIAALNTEEPHTIIHTILFGKSKAGEVRAAAQLRLIAEKNGGTFRRVNQK